MTDEDFKQSLTSVMGNLLRQQQQELYRCSQTELDRYWYFVYDETMSKTWNIYVFSECLEMYKKKCRQWEEHHNGSLSVVERVRDAYLWPKIKEFEERLMK